MDIITLIDKYVGGLLKAQEKFLENLNGLSDLEETVSELSNRTAAESIGMVLTDADQLIRESGIRKKDFKAQRKRQRTLISSVGDINFTHRLYKDKEGKTDPLPPGRADAPAGRRTIHGGC